MADVNEVVNGDEHILWKGRPAMLPFFAGSLLAVSLGIALLEVAVVLWKGVTAGGSAGVLALLFLSPFLLVGVFLAVAFPLYRLLLYMNTSYAITDKRVLLMGGIIAKDVFLMDFDQIGNASVNVDYLDILLGFGQTGSISITRHGAPGDENATCEPRYLLSHVFRPYEILKSLERAEFDVKADMEYPNRLRPETNPGYATEYPPEAANS